jgi:triosephosphate isomerase (TIM)
MKKLYIVANWKSHMHVPEATKWLDQVAAERNKIIDEQKEVIVCPPFTLLQALKYKIDTFGSLIRVGAQDVSPFEEGSHTGEIAASMLKEFCSYVIVGHSERRKELGETDEQIGGKIQHAAASGLVPILCVQDENTPVPGGVTMAAYEPLFAIGTGQADTPENAAAVCRKIKEAHPNVTALLYGGSVTPDNVRSFTQTDAIDGVLVGSGSLDASTFIGIVQNA